MLIENFSDIFQMSEKFLIALEGCNGSGKTTLCKKLTEYYGLPYVAGVPLCMHSNHELRERLFSSVQFESAFLYYLSGVMLQGQYINEIDSEFVIMDRSILSTLAYHYSLGRMQRLAHIIRFLQLLEYKPTFPHLVIWVDAPLEISKKRLKLRNVNDITDVQLSDSTIFRNETEFYTLVYNEFVRAKQAEVIRFDTSSLEPDQAFECLAALIGRKLTERGISHAANDK